MSVQSRYRSSHLVSGNDATAILDDCGHPTRCETVDVAHRLIQLHGGHHHCQSRAAALATLEQEGHYVLSTRFDKIPS